MSAQGGTLERIGAVRLPMWPVAALVAGMVAAAIGISMIGGPNEATLVTRVTNQERFENSAAAIREQGATLPVVWGVSHVTPAAPSFTGFENPGAYGAAETAYASGFENPGAYPATGTASDGDFTPTIGARPGMTGENICGQCG